MRIRPTAIADVQLIEPRVFADERGYFMETWNARGYEAAGIPGPFVQDNHSLSVRGTLRGLHYQVGRPQGKLVRVVAGAVFDVAVDLRRGSPTFGHWVGELLSAENRLQMWIPGGFAHGFCTLSDTAEFLYKCTDYYSPGDERCIRWDDPDLAIDWPLDRSTPLRVSSKDAAGSLFSEAETY